MFMRTAHMLKAFNDERQILVIRLPKSSKKWVSPFKLPPDVKQLKNTWDEGIVEARPDALATAKAIKAQLEEHRQSR
jgi:hypothetical protein